jgi:hypothetical protein
MKSTIASKVSGKFQQSILMAKISLN